MAQHSLNHDTNVPGHAAISEYLNDLSARLSGPRRRRAQILTELRDGLDQATDEHVRAGLPPERAAAAAVAQFGSPHEVADAFASELATAYSRRTLATYITTGPLVGIWWLLLLRPDPWRAGPIALLAAIPVLPLIAIAIAAAGGTLAGTGRLMRWLPEVSPLRALAAVITVAALCLVGDLTMTGLLTASDTPINAVAVIALGASAIRVASGITVIPRTVRMVRPLAPRPDKQPSPPTSC
jgi:hypothetical protein